MKNLVGKSIKIKAGTKTTRAGRTATRQVSTVVTVRRQEAAKNGKTRVFWKSHGVIASALI